MSEASLTQDIFIGVDGGATKTIVRAENASGQSLGQGQGGPANIRLSVEGSWQSINDALKEALASTGLRVDDGQHRFYCGAGLAGTEVTSACDHFLNTPHPFDQLILKSDGYTSCLGAHGGRDGALIAIGTGTVAFQIEGDKEYKAGGWGFPHGDEGSGAWLGLEAVRLTLHWLDGRDEPSPLLESVYAHFDDDLMRLVIWANQANATQFAQIAPLVIDHAKQKTPLALTLIKQAAVEVDRLAVSACGSKSKQVASVQPARRAGAVYRTMVRRLPAVTAGALRIGLGKWRAADDSQSRSPSSFARNP